MYSRLNEFSPFLPVGAEARLSLVGRRQNFNRSNQLIMFSVFVVNFQRALAIIDRFYDDREKNTTGIACVTTLTTIAV